MSDQEPTSIVVSEPSKKAKKKLTVRKRWVVTVAVLFVAIAIVIIVIGSIISHHQTKKQPISFASSIANIDTLSAKNDNQQALSTLQTIKPTSTAQQLIVWSRIAAVYYDQANYAKALEYYKLMLSKDPNNNNTLYNAAQCAQAVGDNKDAKTYYQTILTSIMNSKNHSPTYQSDERNLQNLIQQLN